MPHDLEPAELARYGRHIVLPEVGLEGQRRLKAGSVLLVGAGGLGSPAALYLAAAGVGRLGIVDSDPVEASNLQRQVLHDTGDVGRPKTDSARERLRALNPHVEVETHDVHLDSSNALDILPGWDVVVDGSDNFPTRYLVNDACVLLALPYVFGAILRFEGQASVFGAPDGPCYRCLFREPPPPDLVPSCSEAGVLGVLPGIVGAIQATEAIKLLLGQGETLVGRLLLIDALRMEFREVRVRKDPECPACGERPTITELIDYEEFCGIRSAAGGRAELALGASTRPAARPPAAPAPTATGGRAGRGPPTVAGGVHADGVPAIGPAELRERLAGAASPRLVDVRDGWEWEISNLEGAGDVMRIPLPELAERIGELDPQEDLVLYCRTGSRSGQAVRMLRERGFTRVSHLEGGINAWAAAIDPDMPRY